MGAQMPEQPGTYDDHDQVDHDQLGTDGSGDHDQDLAQDQRSGADHQPDTEVPVTGEPEVDRALESLQGLESAPLPEHHDRLARVHEELHQALNPDHP